MSMLLECKIDTDKIIYVYRPDMQREKTLINKPGTGSWKILISYVSVYYLLNVLMNMLQTFI